MNRKSWKIILLVILVLAFICSGCMGHGSSTKEKVLYTKTDATGTRLDFLEKPKKIVSLGIGSDEVLIDLVDANKIAALTYLVDDEGISSVSKEAKTIKGRVQRENLESILSFSPDLVIVPDWGGIDFVPQLRASGIKVYVHKTPNSIEEIQATIMELADLVGEKENGQHIIDEMNTRLNIVWEKVSKLKDNEKRKIVALSFMGPMGIKGSSFDDMCRRANLINGVRDLNIPKNATFSEEEMLLLNPDIILVPSWDYSGTKDTGEFKRKIMTNPAYQGISAIRRHSVVQVHDKYLYSTSQYAVNGIEELAEVSYPELYLNNL